MNNPQQHIVVQSHDDHGYLKITVPFELETAFKTLIARALNTYTDAHPALKEFGDILEHGKPLQDYYSQRSDIKITKR